jgi:hypothetical protein
MSQDIMADSQTEATLAALDRGEVDDKMRDRVLAALLRSQTRMLDALVKIKENLWDMDKLESLIDKRHQVLCTNCVLRQQALTKSEPDKKEDEPKKSWIELILTSEATRYFILMVILVWAIVYVKSGAEGVASVRDGVTHTVRGGIPK